MKEVTEIQLHNIDQNSFEAKVSSVNTVKVGISACLMGHEVRFNGGHTQSRLCLDSLSKHFEFRPFCPEVAAGFGTPRPTMRLVGTAENPSLAWSKGGESDLSAQLRSGFQEEVSAIDGLDGYIFMAKSPSCGLHRVKVYDKDGVFNHHYSQGLYAKALQQRYPLMPMEDEGRLNDSKLYENFILRVYAFHNFKKEVGCKPSIKALIDFHKSYKYVLMAHSQQSYKKLGRLLSKRHPVSVDVQAMEYLESFMSAISKPASCGNHANTLLHILGYLKKVTPSQARKNIVDIIIKYKNGLVPLVTPMTLLNHYVQLHGSRYVKEQRYLQPYPEALGLTNSI